MNFQSRDLTPGNAQNTSWQQTNEARDGARQLDRRRGADRDVLSGLRRRKTMAPEGMHPFKVYLAQICLSYSEMLAIDPNPANWWTYFLVRCGRVTSGVSAARAVEGTGCDGFDGDPYSDFFSGEDDDSAPVVPIQAPTGLAADAPFYIWLEIGLSDGTPAIRYGTDPTDNGAAENDWASYPVPDGLHFEIAEIATSTPYQAVVRQLINADIPPPLVLELTVTGVSDDYLDCQDAYHNAVKVAKPTELRCGAWADADLAVTLADGAHTYHYISPTIRQDSSTAPDGTVFVGRAVIWPPYNAGDTITAVVVDGGSGAFDDDSNPIPLVSVDSRVWASQVPYCYNSHNGWVLALNNPYTTLI